MVKIRMVLHSLHWLFMRLAWLGLAWRCVATALELGSAVM